MTVTVLAAMASLLAATPVSADTFTVTGFDDLLTPPPCTGSATVYSCTTLRAAVEQANTTPGADSIQLLAGSYAVSAGDLVLSDGVVVAGMGARETTVASDGSDRVFTVSSPTDVTLGLMTIRGGFSGSQGGNISVTPGASLGLSFVRVTGGAAAQGAGIGNEGELTVAYSTIDSNTAQLIGGGIDNLGEGTVGASVNVGNSTIVNNIAPTGGAISSRGSATNTVDLFHATVARNTNGAIWFEQQQDANAYGSILAANVMPNCDGPGTLDGSGNVDSGSSCGLPAATNRVNTDPLVAAALSNQGGQFATDVLTIPANSPAVDYVTPCFLPTDQRNLARTQGACDAGAYEQSAGGGGEQPPTEQPPPTTPTPEPPPPPQPTPTPVVNQTAVVREVRGTVKVQLPGTRTFVDIDATRGIPMGSTIDTRKGAVELTSVPKAGAPPEKATFYDGLFRVTQSRGITSLTLVEELNCPKRGRAAASARKPKKRKLWGDGKGAFRTSGRYSAATVRGTRWLVEDTCTTTTITVRVGSVRVEDFVTKKKKVIRAPKKYVARARK